MSALSANIMRLSTVYDVLSPLFVAALPLLVGKLGAMILSTISLAILGRSLGPEGYGIYTFAFSTVGLLVPLVVMGTDLSAVRLIAQDDQSDGQRDGYILVAATLFRLIIALVAFFTLRLIISFGPILTDVTAALSLYSPVLLVTALNSAGIILQSRRRFRSIAVFGILLNTITLFGTAAGALHEASPSWFLGVLLIANLITGVATWGVAVTFIRGPIGISRSTILDIIRSSFPLGLSALLVTTYVRIDMLMLGSIASSEALGNYAAAYKFVDIALFLPSAIILPLYPRLAGAKASQHMDVHNVMMAVSRFLIVASVLAASTLFLGADIAIQALYGSSFSTGALLLRILSVEIVLSCVATVLDTYLIARGNPRVRLRIGSVNLVVNLSLNALLIPWLGPVGAALTTLITEASSIAQLATLRDRHFPLGLPWGVLAKGILAVGALLLVALLTGLSWPANQMAGVLVFLLVIWKIRLLRASDFGHLRP